ncbi:hypothetical protein TorRG33x02_068130 [Trema orientale]|uniref:Uncharacterized protein n=1 Tax=Trema orientale TaxID=63057 RepID=A0A2P5FHV1_TREOI|nr:hypothetical protein TorRG33x02_068130 [Trema orientale]
MVTLAVSGAGARRVAASRWTGVSAMLGGYAWCGDGAPRANLKGWAKQICTEGPSEALDWRSLPNYQDSPTGSQRMDHGVLLEGLFWKDVEELIDEVWSSKLHLIGHWLDRSSSYTIM